MLFRGLFAGQLGFVSGKLFKLWVKFLEVFEGVGLLTRTFY